MEYTDDKKFTGGLTPDEAQELTELEAAFSHNGGRGVDLAERIDELRRMRGFLTEEEADEVCDALNANEDVGQSWQAAFVNDGDEDYWIVSLENTEDED